MKTLVLGGKRVKLSIWVSTNDDARITYRDLMCCMSLYRIQPAKKDFAL